MSEVCSLITHQKLQHAQSCGENEWDICVIAGWAKVVYNDRGQYFSTARWLRRFPKVIFSTRLFMGRPLYKKEKQA